MAFLFCEAENPRDWHSHGTGCAIRRSAKTGAAAGHGPDLGRPFIGLFAGLAAAGLLGSFLFGVRPTDPASFACVALLLTGIALLACFIPARRAVRVDPMIALRYE